MGGKCREIRVRSQIIRRESNQVKSVKGGVSLVQVRPPDKGFGLVRSQDVRRESVISVCLRSDGLHDHPRRLGGRPRRHRGRCSG